MIGREDDLESLRPIVMVEDDVSFFNIRLRFNYGQGDRPLEARQAISSRPSHGR